MKDTDAIMRRLGYDRAALELGIVDSETLEAQHSKLEANAGCRSEDLRFAAFAAFLGRTMKLADGEVEAVLRFCRTEVDPSVRASMIIQLVSCGVLLDAQLALLADHRDIREEPIRTRYLRETLRRKMKSDGLTDDVFHAVLQSRDAYLQREALARAEMLPAHAESLAAHGANRTVRNLAGQLLNRMKCSKPSERE